MAKAIELIVQRAGPIYEVDYMAAAQEAWREALKSENGATF